MWDRLLGTSEPEAEPVRSGLTHDIGTYRPLRIAFHEWWAIARDVARAGSPAEALGPPGWRPDGAGETAATLRAAETGEPTGAEAQPA